MSRSEVDLAALEADPRVTWTEDVLRFRDTDANGHVNNAVFSTFCESGRVQVLHEVLKEGREANTFYVIVRLVLEFRAELHYPGRARAATWLVAAGRTSMTFRQALFDDSGQVFATAESVVVYMDTPTRRPKPMGEVLHAQVTSLVREE
ncbi:acyl-CoA thioesterase [Enterovirga rhinocerotis]|uniref:(3S)-malyl-CoA thioesterase n=1 Tax=Enterovirga rhinocerotis TaxID=1339210 RepID=A0A4R7BNX1_9HYPH|nr:acyl-CoA thioesterase [Enterovirga rhinocerotis]TDR87208.1 (3S)-malyl-CoA thioesterase [Enterovirga rhinocerotis]